MAETAARESVEGTVGTSRGVIRTLGQVDHLRQKPGTGPGTAAAAGDGDVVTAARAAVAEDKAPAAGPATSPRAPTRVKGGNGLGQTLVSRECDAAEKGDPAAAYRLGRRYL